MKNNENGFVLLEALISFFVVLFFVLASGSLIKAMSDARKDIEEMDAAIQKFYQILGRRHGEESAQMTVAFLATVGESREVIVQKKYKIDYVRGPQEIFYGGICPAEGFSFA